MKRLLSLYWMSVDAGLSHVTARITSPVIGLLSKFSRSFREINDYRSSKAFSQRRNGQNDSPVHIASFALPGISLFSLLMIAFSLLNVPISFYHLIIFLALFAFAVYMCIKTVKNNKDDYKKEFKQMSGTQRRKWIILSCLFVLVCIILPFILMPFA